MVLGHGFGGIGKMRGLKRLDSFNVREGEFVGSERGPSGVRIATLWFVGIRMLRGQGDRDQC